MFKKIIFLGSLMTLTTPVYASLSLQTLIENHLKADYQKMVNNPQTTEQKKDNFLVYQEVLTALAGRFEMGEISYDNFQKVVLSARPLIDKEIGSSSLFEKYGPIIQKVMDRRIKTVNSSKFPKIQHLKAKQENEFIGEMNRKIADQIKTMALTSSVPNPVVSDSIIIEQPGISINNPAISLSSSEEVPPLPISVLSEIKNISLEEKEEFENKITGLVQQLTDAEKEYQKKLDQERELRKKAEDSFEKEKNTLNQKFRSLNQAHHNLREEFKKLQLEQQEQKNSAKLELTRRTEEITRLTTEFERAKKKMSELTSQNKSYSLSLQRQGVELKTKDKTIAGLNQTITKHQRSLDQLSNQNKQLTQDYEAEKQKEHKRFQYDLNNLSKQNEDYQKEITTLNQTLLQKKQIEKNNEAEIDQLRKSLAQKETQLTEGVEQTEKYGTRNLLTDPLLPSIIPQTSPNTTEKKRLEERIDHLSQRVSSLEACRTYPHTYMPPITFPFYYYPQVKTVLVNWDEATQTEYFSFVGRPHITNDGRIIHQGTFPKSPGQALGSPPYYPYLKSVVVDWDLLTQSEYFSFVGSPHITNDGRIIQQGTFPKPQGQPKNKDGEENLF